MRVKSVFAFLAVFATAPALSACLVMGATAAVGGAVVGVASATVKAGAAAIDAVIPDGDDDDDED